jgi:hypothetical protein
MRTTLNLDDALLEQMTRRFPPGTPKTVIIEESLRRALETPAPRPGVALPTEVERLVRLGVLVPAARTGVPPQSDLPPLPPGLLLADLASDRDDR